ncbi:MAG: ester cyclase [Ferruginibacter sp.]
MKKFLFVSAAALCCFFISCKDNDGGGLSPAAQKNLDANHAIQKAFETKDFSKIGDYIADDAVDHAGEKGDVKGLENMKAAFTKMAAMTENDKMDIKKELADDEYVMSWSRYSGKMKTEGMGMKPGDPFDMGAIEVTKFKDGKATEHWSFMDMADMMKMMPPMPAGGAMPPMPMDTTKKDTTKKM